MSEQVIDIEGTDEWMTFLHKESEKKLTKTKELPAGEELTMEELETEKGWSPAARAAAAAARKKQGPVPLTHEGLQSFAKAAGITVKRQHREGDVGGSAAVHHKDFGMGGVIYSGAKGVHADFAMRKGSEVNVARGYGSTFERAWKRATDAYRELHFKGWRNAWTG